MKVLIVTPKYYPDTFPINLIAERMSKEGHDVHVLTSVPFHNGEYVKEFNKSVSRENGVTVYRVKAYIRTSKKTTLIKNYLSLAKELKKWVRKTRNPYDIVYSYSVSPVTALGAGNLYKRKHHVKHIAHVLDLWPESVVDAGYTKKGSPLYQTLLRRSKKEYRQLDHLLVGSKSFIDYLNTKMKINESKITYLPQPGLVYEDKKAENPYNSKKTNLVYCGNIAKLQLLDLIVPTMEKLNNENVVFNIVGTGSYLEELKNEIKSKNISNVIYHGYFNYQESMRYLENADAIFVPLKNKGFVGKTIPNKLISSLYYSKPIIGMISGEGEEILKENNNILVEESSDGLVKGINEFLSLTKADKEKIGNKNRQMYDDNYSLDIFIKKLLSSLSRK